MKIKTKVIYLAPVINEERNIKKFLSMICICADLIIVADKSVTNKMAESLQNSLK